MEKCIENRAHFISFIFWKRHKLSKQICCEVETLKSFFHLARSAIFFISVRLTQMQKRRHQRKRTKSIRIEITTGSHWPAFKPSFLQHRLGKILANLKLYGESEKRRNMNWGKFYQAETGAIFYGSKKKISQVKVMPQTIVRKNMIY